jgi:hypothetical protein
MRRKEKTSPWMGMMMEKEKKDKWGGRGGYQEGMQIRSKINNSKRSLAYIMSMESIIDSIWNLNSDYGVVVRSKRRTESNLD